MQLVQLVAGPPESAQQRCEQQETAGPLAATSGTSPRISRDRGRIEENWRGAVAAKRIRIVAAGGSFPESDNPISGGASVRRCLQAFRNLPRACHTFLQRTGNSPRTVEKIVDAVLKEVYQSLKQGERVSLRNFGTFCVRPEQDSWVFTFNPSQRLPKLFGWPSTY